MENMGKTMDNLEKLQIWSNMIKIDQRWSKMFTRIVQKFDQGNCNRFTPTSSYWDCFRWAGLRKNAASLSEWTSLPVTYCLGQPPTSKGHRFMWKPCSTATRLLDRSPLGMAFWTCFGSLPPKSTHCPFQFMALIENIHLHSSSFT